MTAAIIASRPMRELTIRATKGQTFQLVTHRSPPNRKTERKWADAMQERNKELSAFTVASDIPAVIDAIEAGREIVFQMDERDGRPLCEHYAGPRTIEAVQLRLAQLSDNGKLWTMMFIDGCKVKLGKLHSGRPLHFFGE
jgi:hypothetical protein